MTFIESLLEGQQLDIHGDGLQTRTFTYVTDTVDGVVRALRTPESRGQVINIGGTECITILELAERIQAAIGIAPPLRVHFTPYEALPGNYQDVRERMPDTTKASRILGFEASVPLNEGLVSTLEWHRERRVDDRAASA